MDTVVSIFQIVWVVGFLSGVLAAIGLISLSKHGENVPFLLKNSGLSVFFAKYYPNHDNHRRIVLMLEVVCISCILVGVMVLLSGVLIHKYGL